MREIRLALLEADVNFKVVKQFTAAVRERASAPTCSGSSTPASRSSRSSRGADRADGRPGRRDRFASRPPTVILMAGLQGSGKTTAAAKLARYLHEEHQSSVALAACDTYTPAAVEQLVTVGAQAGATVYEQGTERSPVRSRRLGARARPHRGQGRADRRHERPPARRRRADGRARRDPRGDRQPDDVLLVLDAMTGQDAVNVAEQFAAALPLDGTVMTKLDGDARGGAALSVRAVTASRSCSPRPARSSTSSSASTPSAWRSGSSAWATS
jgi:signal recognition particle subunit SRP54